MTKLEENIIIIGGLHHNTLGVIRSLGEDGIKPNNMIIVLIGKHINKKNIISIHQKRILLIWIQIVRLFHGCLNISRK